VKVSGGVLSISWNEREEREYLVPAAAHILVRDGEEVMTGQELTTGPKNPQDILRIEGHEAVQRYMIDEVQAVYRSQGVSMHDKHVEVIIRQMLRKVRVDAPGDTDLLPGELIDRTEYERVNNQILAEGGEPATASPMLLGVTRASLSTDSFLAAASFQETARVLTEAAVNGSVDHLLGLKENVIIGRLIPARLDQSQEGRDKLGIEELGERRPGTLTGLTQPPATFEEALAAIGGANAAFGPVRPPLGEGGTGDPGYALKTAVPGSGDPVADEPAEVDGGAPGEKSSDTEAVEAPPVESPREAD